MAVAMRTAPLIVAGLVALALPARADVPAPPRPGDYVQVDDLPEVIRKVNPVPPSPGASGTVLLQALVGEDGRVKEIIVERSAPELDSAAVRALWQWVFKPAMAKGKPTAVWVAVPMRFGSGGPPAGTPPPPTPAAAAVESLGVESLNRIVEASLGENWVRSPHAVAMRLAAELVGKSDCRQSSVQVDSGPEGRGPVKVLVALDQCNDDSILAFEYRLQLSPDDRGVWRARSGTRAWRCRPGRGHGELSSLPCR
jgi:TonB family protein